MPLSKKIQPMSSKKYVKLLARGGVRFVRQSGTSHVIFERENVGKVSFMVMGKKELSPKYMELVLPVVFY